MWTNYSVVAKIDAQEESYQTTLFLHSIAQMPWQSTMVSVQWKIVMC